MEAVNPLTGLPVGTISLQDLARGARIAAAEGRITDSKGELLASGTTTCLIFPASGA